MRTGMALGALAFLLTGCGLGRAASRPTAIPGGVATRPSAAPTKRVVSVDPAFASFLNSVCSALRRGDSGKVSGSLMYYQYNSGLRWGMLDNSEGNTADPSLLNTWLAHARPRCVAFTPGVAGHGTLLSVGWLWPAPASLIDLDSVNGQWKINDFTFGSRTVLARAMQINHPILTYRG